MRSGSQTWARCEDSPCCYSFPRRPASTSRPCGLRSADHTKSRQPLRNRTRQSEVLERNVCCERSRYWFHPSDSLTEETWPTLDRDFRQDQASDPFCARSITGCLYLAQRNLQNWRFSDFALQGIGNGREQHGSAEWSFQSESRRAARRAPDGCFLLR